ncbi:MAG TPA: putative DNA binding domain-containing protein [Anaerolineaceae bacterium]|nr:putative DNA binding domain-containing protein [Anaerolineaceae bacterium]
MDIHLHTPASMDFQQPEVSYLDILKKADSRNLDIISFTDHNTIAGYRKLREEIEQLELLEKLNRLLPEEKNHLLEYRSLLKKILLLPGIEFTATFGFHIIGLFSPTKSIREIEHTLLDLGIPPANIDDGNPAIGASIDVITAYRIINEAGGIVIAAHANSSNGVAMRGMNFGGQTRIAYTQDKNLHALEVTDLDQRGSRSTAAFFNGTKPEYPRRMHCIQGSDSHRLTTDPIRKKNPGIGDRTTDVLLPEPSFEALLELFKSNDFSRTRPHRQTMEPAVDFVQIARDEGPNIIQDFHENLSVRGGNMHSILADICAFANTNGGTIYIGVPRDPLKPVIGIANPSQAMEQLEKEIQNRISPPIHVTLDVQTHKNKSILRILIPRGEEAPYALDENKIYIRDEDETNIAVRDEIVTLVLRGREQASFSGEPPSIVEAVQSSVEIPQTAPELTEDPAPRTGVEVIAPVTRGGKSFYTMRDLRNGNIVKNVTQASARRLWHYAITRYNEIFPQIDSIGIVWHGDYGLIKQYQQGKNSLFDLILRTADGYRLFFGVTTDGIHGPWKSFLQEEEIA